VQQQNDSMTPYRPEVKRISLRLDGDVWEAAVIAAAKRRTSVQAMLTRLVKKELGFPVSDEPKITAA
jgi:predicted HicB family RNase H-like nuclease